MEDVTFSRVLVCPFSENTHELDMNIQKPQVCKMLNSTDDPEQVCSLNSKNSNKISFKIVSEILKLR